MVKPLKMPLVATSVLVAAEITTGDNLLTNGLATALSATEHVTTGMGSARSKEGNRPARWNQ